MNVHACKNTDLRSKQRVLLASRRKIHIVRSKGELGHFRIFQSQCLKVNTYKSADYKNKDVLQKVGEIAQKGEVHLVCG